MERPCLFFCNKFSDIICYLKPFQVSIYHKVTGEKPGKELKSWSYSVKEVADLLEVDDYLVYDLLKKNQMEALSFHSRISSIRH